MREPAVECIVTRYTSKFDQSRQSIMELRPTNGLRGDLFIFFHGMDGDCGDAVVLRELVSGLGGTVIAPGGRGPAWVSDAFLVDAGQIIRKYTRDRTKVYLVGISMGATQALVLAAGLGGSLGAKLAGVIAFIPGADLIDIAANSSNARVRDTLVSAVTCDHGRLSERSPSTMVAQYPAGLPFAIAYNEADTMLPVAPTAAFVESLKARGLAVNSYVIPGEHSFVTDQLDERIDYRRILADLGASNDEPSPVPTLRPPSVVFRKAG
jgi:dienelactone hydrolase